MKKTIYLTSLLFMMTLATPSVCAPIVHGHLRTTYTIENNTPFDAQYEFGYAQAGCGKDNFPINAGAKESRTKLKKCTLQHVLATVKSDPYQYIEYTGKFGNTDNGFSITTDPDNATKFKIVRTQ